MVFAAEKPADAVLSWEKNSSSKRESSLNKISIDQGVAPQAKKTILTETEKDVSSIRCYRQMDASANSIEPHDLEI